MQTGNGARPTRVLLVEDEMMVSMLIEDMLVDLGFEVVGPFVRVGDALEAARNEEIDVAVLDFNLNGETSYPVAWTLRERNVPFVFATGYGASVLNQTFRDIPLLQKPFERSDLNWALRRALQDTSPMTVGSRSS
jgi:DNA-binding response OmpR family regulator